MEGSYTSVRMRARHQSGWVNMKDEQINKQQEGESEKRYECVNNLGEPLDTNDNAMSHGPVNRCLVHPLLSDGCAKAEASRRFWLPTA
ncbi:hypothetical protein E2C01_047539 [Portunus trituberculatus]|uniref:Uncharacterized protein n=1 Tax=Portunus trituberculatus TaxID=210409 RepID=A0A5B7G1E1_PORTR|nr:hypothetical protein [Portunus trituberculatus]